MKKYLIAGIVAVAVALVAVSANAALTRNLSVGSTGADVAELQTFLISKGFSIPAISSGVAVPGYFGSQTKAAVMAYQAANGIPSTGFFGPLTMASVNAKMGGGIGGAVCPVGYNCTPTGVVVVCPVGFICTPIAGGTPVTGGGITTPGVEGTISATQSSAGIESTVYEGQTMAPILGAKVEAKNSDISIQRVKLDLGTATTLYNKIYSKIYVTDGTNVLASADLNSSNVVKDGSIYYITIAGFNYIVPKNTTKSLVIKVDVRSSIDSTDLSSNYTVRFAANGIRGIDGAGIDQFSPAAATDITKTMNVDADLSEAATLTLSLNPSTPKKSDVIVTSGSTEDEGRFTALVFDVKAEKDDVKITDIHITVAKSGSGAAAVSTAYIYADGIEVDNAAISGGTATFTNFNRIIPRDTTKTYTVMIDVSSANSVDARFIVSASTTLAAGFVAENSRGDSITESGSAAGQSIGIRNVGLEVSLVSKPTIVAAGAPQNNGVTTNVSTSTLSANFIVRVKAVGGAIQLGTVASSTASAVSTMFSSSTLGFKIYRDSVADLTISSYATTTDYTNPSGLTVTDNTFTIPEGATYDIPVTFGIMGRSKSAAFTSGSYAVELQSIQQNASYAVTFMAGEGDWRTPGIAFPS